MCQVSKLLGYWLPSSNLTVLFLLPLMFLLCPFVLSYFFLGGGMEDKQEEGQGIRGLLVFSLCCWKLSKLISVLAYTFFCYLKSFCSPLYLDPFLILFWLWVG